MTRKKVPQSSEIDRLGDAHYSGLGRRRRHSYHKRILIDSES
jgi:hypothetical protein